ncbi:MAG: UDP-3-O-(3-hydroxymyristoyl)glucosamine N-acyltransferase [Bacteroidota bacterium]|nr:UDP-3-O-(3-hydroxymyristoyl)glucosamine N-acyltransferase [Bacteroidota bacterium]
MEYTAKTIAELISGEVIGNLNKKVTSITKIEEGVSGSLSFLANPAYANYLFTTKSSVILIGKDSVPEEKVTPTLIVVDDAYKAFAMLVDIYQKIKNEDLRGIEKMSFIDKTAILGTNIYIAAFAYISKNTSIGDNVKIYPNVFIGKNVQIGDGTILHAGVKIYHDCKIGKNCIIHAGTVIGSDGFGFAPQKDGTFYKIQQIGNVIIEDNVEVGSNTSIDRATLGSTKVKKGVKLDNLIQIAHNVEIGENTVIASQTGIAGSTKLGKNCLVGGQVGFVGHINIANKTNIGAQAGIVKAIKKEGKMFLGSPAFELSKFHRSYSVFKNLPSLNNEITDLKKQLSELQKKIDEINKHEKL